MPALNALYREYATDAAFYIVYIQEAHPIDAWQVNANVADDVLVASPNTDQQRASVAGVCMTKLGIEFPALVDGTDNAVERAYTAWPDRLYVIDRDGRVAYKSAVGPFGFKPAEVEETLRHLFPER